MSLSSWSMYLNRTAKVLQESTSRVLRMSGADPLDRAPRTLFAFRTRADVAAFATGCDADVGGTSSVHLALEDDPADAGVRANVLPGGAGDGAQEQAGAGAGAGGRPYARFWGEMRLGVRRELQGRVRGGYAGMRNKARPTLFGEQTDDVSNYEYLALRVRAAGHPRTRSAYFVNVQTDGPVTTDLWQHRLYFHRDDGGWEDLFIPFSAFVLTNSGELQDTQMTMYRERIRSVGVSLLGGHSGVEGPYELGLASIRAVNEDVSVRPGGAGAGVGGESAEKRRVEDAEAERKGWEAGPLDGPEVVRNT